MLEVKNKNDVWPSGADTAKRLDRNYENRRRMTTKKTVLTTIVAALLGIVFLINLFTHVFPVIRYYGNGMNPSLSSGQFLVLLKTKNVKEGDVVAFYYNNKILVRRVICEGGKRLNLTQDGSVYINGTKLDETYIAKASFGQCNLDFPYYVTPYQFFVMGDDREIAMDSRLKEIGTIPADRIIGKVLLSL